MPLTGTVFLQNRRSETHEKAAAAEMIQVLFPDDGLNDQFSYQISSHM